MNRKICSIDGCNKLTRNKGSYKGITRYDHLCESHHRLRLNPKNISTHLYYWRKIIDNSKCERCGWNEAHCDRHRIKPELGYIRENVKILCPNCHRLEEINKQNNNLQ